MKFQLAIIGGGPAGYTAAEAAGKAGLSVVLFEKNSLGGVCLNEGCIPTKTLLYSAKVYDYARHASKAYIVDKNTVRCADETYECEHLIICTGSQTVIPPIQGIDQVSYWTHRDALDNKELPRSLAIVGGGDIGMEFASFLNGIDRELAASLRTEYSKKGVKFLLGAKVTSLSQDDEGIHVHYENADGANSICADKLLMSVGRRPVTEGFGLENLNLELTERRHIRVDAHLRTSVPGVYVCGDLNGVSLLAHTAVREAEIAVKDILGEPEEMSYRAIPGVVYTNPEIASVGQTEEVLQANGTSYRTVKLPMAYSGRFVAENEGSNGVIKVLVDDKDTVLGVHILGNPASELIVLGGMMVEEHRNLEYFKRFVFPHPTVGEIFREL